MCVCFPSTTLGFERNPEMLSVLLEMVIRRINGVSRYFFRELYQELQSYCFTNTRDASGLESLAQSKKAFHPHKIVENYIATLRE